MCYWDLNTVSYPYLSGNNITPIILEKYKEISVYNVNFYSDDMGCCQSREKLTDAVSEVDKPDQPSGGVDNPVKNEPEPTEPQGTQYI